MNALPHNFYTMPRAAKTTMSRKDLKELLLSTNGNILACGRLYDIESKHIGAGVYKVWLNRSN